MSEEIKFNLQFLTRNMLNSQFKFRSQCQAAKKQSDRLMTTLINTGKAILATDLIIFKLKKIIKRRDQHYIP